MQETPDAGARGAQRSLPPARRRQERQRTGDTGSTGNKAVAPFRGSKLLGLLHERPHDNDLKNEIKIIVANLTVKRTR